MKKFLILSIVVLNSCGYTDNISTTCPCIVTGVVKKVGSIRDGDGDVHYVTRVESTTLSNDSFTLIFNEAYKIGDTLKIVNKR